MSFSITGTPLYQTNTGATAAGGAEVSAYDAARKLVFILGPNGVDALDAATGALRFSLPGSAAGITASIGGTSVAVKGDQLAVAYEGATNGLPGSVALYRLDATGTGAALAQTVQVGATPDQIVFTADGSRLLVTIEGQPFDYDPAQVPAGTLRDAPGGITIVDTASFATSFAGFDSFDADALRAAGVRIKAGATAAEDLEPEYTTISADGTKAYVTLQENNAIAVLDLTTGTFTDVFALGTKDHSIAGNGIDPSDRDGGANIRTVPVKGLYMPDGITNFESDGKTYLVTANEGDAREYGTYRDTARVSTLALDEAAFGGAAAVAALKTNAELGRLTVSTVDGDTDGDGDIDVLYALGGRSMSIWEVGEDGLTQVYDSGDLMERILARDFPALLDDNRSDDKGPEPESVTLGRVDGKLYAFVALERSDSVMAFRIDAPDAVSYAGLVQTGDAPEVVTFVSAEDAPAGIGSPMLIAPSEGDGIATGIRLSFPILGSEEADVLRGTAGNDAIAAGGGDDLIFASRGEDAVQGGDGRDTLRFDELSLGNATLGRDANGTAASLAWTDAAGASTTSFTGIETVKLIDATISFTGDSAGAQVASLYRGLLGREADGAGLSFWADRVEEGGLSGVAGALLASGESQAALAGLSTDAVVSRLYEAVLGRAASDGEIASWRGAAQADLASVASGIAGSAEAVGDPTGAATAGIVTVDSEMAWIAHSFQGLLGRAPELAGLARFDGMMDAGLSEAGLVTAIAASQEFGIRTAGLSDAGYVAWLYDGVLGRAGDAEGAALHVASLQAGMARDALAYDFLASVEAAGSLNGVLSDGVSIL
jgi:DNA-binding beta-propeller fold protein YncE